MRILGIMALALGISFSSQATVDVKEVVLEECYILPTYDIKYIKHIENDGRYGSIFELRYSYLKITKKKLFFVTESHEVHEKEATIRTNEYWTSNSLTKEGVIQGLEGFIYRHTPFACQE